LRQLGPAFIIDQIQRAAADSKDYLTVMDLASARGGPELGPSR